MIRIPRLQCCLYLSAAFFITACTTQKVALDAVKVSANAPGSTIYRGSYTKLTDILHTKLDINFNWDSAFVIGKATIKARPYFYPSNQLILNANGFKINEVSLEKKEDRTPLNYLYDGKLLTIQLDKTYTNTDTYTVFIDYVAMPNKLKAGVDINSNDDRGVYFIKDPRQVWTQGETECNSNWFPTINGPQEKMTQEISITVPEKMVTLSNGELDFSSDNGDGTRTDSWRQDKPHSTYLTMMAAGDFTIVKDKWRNKEVNYYMEPQYAKNARLIFGKTPEMIEFFSKKTGVDFPWDKYSQIVVREFVAGAMENTSATVLFDRMNMTPGECLDENYEDIISHELFHHWFGDLVTAESWANLPLNESFANYGEYLWREYKYGVEDADYLNYKDAQKYLAKPENKTLNAIRFDYADREQMFDAVSYEKGGRVLHMLRKTVGDDAFFKSLKLYLTRYAYKTAEIHNLRMAFEEVTGQDLNWFFNQWFLAAGNPKLNIQTSYDNAKHEAVVTIKQEQDLTKMPLFRLPMAIDIYVDGKAERKAITVTKQSETFSFPVSAEPQLINVDAEKYLLAERTENKTIQQNSYQYAHAPLFMDRIEAVQALSRSATEPQAHATLIKALQDKHWYIRRLAVDFVPKLTEPERKQVLGRIRDMALHDERSYVRAAAISTLKSVYAKEDNKTVFSQAARDKAPSVLNALKN
ncbi:M1 family peptidase (plasmid) [Pedobacter sp. BS3]|nr:M1 family peptidase [Pedobacter sp. BS3]